MEKNVSLQTLIILKSKLEVIAKAESDLEVRGWKIHSGTKIKDILGPLLSEPPKFALICMDHPNPKARILPKLLHEALGINVIVYVENISGSSLAMVKDCDYILYPPINVTAITRMVARIERDARREEENANSAVTKASIGTTNDSMIHIKGERKEAERLLIAERAKEFLTQMLVTEEAPKSKQTGPAVIVTKGEVVNTDNDFVHAKGKAPNTSNDLIHAKGKGINTSNGLVHAKGKPTADSDLIHATGKVNAGDSDLIHAKGKVNAADTDSIYAGGKTKRDKNGVVVEEGDPLVDDKSMMVEKGTRKMVPDFNIVEV